MSKAERDAYFEERAGTDEARFHVVPHGEGHWAVKKEGVAEPECRTDSKSEAVEEAKHLAKKAGTMAYIHDEHGRIDRQHNYEE